MKRVIHWFRRDLRVHDNTALAEAASRAKEVIPVFILEDALRTGPDVGAARLEFLLRSVEELGKNLAARGYSLIVRAGSSIEQIPKLAEEFGAEAVFANIRSEPYAKRRDAKIFNALNERRIGFELFKDAVIWHEDEILTQAGKPYTVFTPYSRAWRARRVPPPHPLLPKVKGSPGPSPEPPQIPSAAAFGHPSSQETLPAGERAALEALERFLRGPIFAYASGRDHADVDATSRLSPHLRAGTIGTRTILARVAEARQKADAAGQKGCDTFVNELIWREFYTQVLHHFPHVATGAFRPEFNRIEWSGSGEHLQAWQEGQTGYPIVDAAMRCMKATGWMHNRLRMIAAMFLTKDLLINWQDGERWFMKQLVDGDMAANNGGWQWSAGTGTDAAPYFRIFNPTTQAEKCDPDGEFTRRWVPELAALKGAAIHRPWDEPLLAGRYPGRIVLHEEQRPKALAMFGRAAKSQRAR